MKNMIRKIFHLEELISNFEKKLDNKYTIVELN